MHVFLILFIKIVITSGGSTIPFFLQSTIYHEQDFPLPLNKTTNPCENFYDYACSNWIAKASSKEPNWNHWQAVSQKINKKLENMLKSKKSTNKYFLKAQELFKSCAHNKNTEGKYVHNLKKLIKNLKGWPMANLKWNSDGYDWFSEVAKIIRNLKVFPMVKMHVFINMKNTSENILYIERGELNLPQEILVNSEKYTQFIKAYEFWIFKTVEYLYPNHTNYKLTETVLDLVKFEVELSKLHIMKDKNIKITIKELEETSSMNWSKAFEKLFYETSIQMKTSDPVILRSDNYLKHLQGLILKTKVETLANYIVWSVVKHLSRETSDYMRKLSFMMDNVVLGTQNDLTQTQECINTVNAYMDTALIMQYSQLHVSPKTVKSVSVIIENVKQAFIETLRQNTWLESATKKLAMEKIASMKYQVGYPDEINEVFLEQKFGMVNVSNNHFLNVLQLKAFDSKYDLEKLRVKPNLALPGSLFEVNAYYSILQNTIFIPVGMLEEPFYYDKRPININYGSLGSLIGHEISHALDILGRHADSKGNIVNWWSTSDIKAYNKRLNCYKQQYQENSADTLAENIADNIGLQISFDAYKNLSSNQLYSKSPLFFIGFAQLWCETPSQNDILRDEHAPVKTRVLETLKNNKEFHEAFSCKDTADKCILW